MTLGQKRALFTRLLSQLIARMVAAGLEPRLDEVKRAPIVAMIYSYDESQCIELSGLVAARFPDLAVEILRLKNVLGSLRSVHIDGLAADIQLFLPDGSLLVKTADHERFGLWWEQQHASCRWGGRFGDGGHYSVTPDGVRK